MKRSSYRWLALAIFLVAAGARLLWLDGIPPGLAQDEVLDADIAEGILQGHHALFFREGWGHEPLYHYYAAIFRPMWGDNLIAIRLPSVFLGMLVVALSMRWAQKEWGRSAALLMGAGVAISWWSIIFGRIGIRAIMEPIWLLIALILWQKRPILAGFFLALTFYTYTPALTLFLLPIFLIGHALIWKQDRRTPLLILVMATSTYLPLFFYLRLHPDLLERGNQLFGPVDALRQGSWQPLWQSLRATVTAFSVSGDPRWTYLIPNRPILPLIPALFFHGGLVVALWHSRQPRYALPLIWLGAGILPSILTPDAPSIIRMIGAMPVVYFFPFLGMEWLGRRLKRYRPMLMPLLTTIYLLSLAQHSVAIGFFSWANAPETRLEKYQAIYRDIANEIAQNATTPIVNDTRFDPIDDDSLRRTLGYDPQARWTQEGQAVILPATPATLYVPEFAPIDPLLFELLQLDSNRPNLRTTTIPSFAAYTLPITPTLPLLPTSIHFGNQLTLLGVGQIANRPILWSYWQVAGKLSADLTLFVHVVSEVGTAPLAQDDRLSAMPMTLRVGDRFIQLHHWTDIDTPYQLLLGAYTRTDQRRLPCDFCQDQLYQIGRH